MPAYHVTEKKERSQLLLCAVVTVLAFLFFRSLARTFGEQGDFQGYLDAGELVLQGADIYSTERNTWPPFFSLVCVPLALIARVNIYLVRYAWLFLNIWAVYSLMKAAIFLVYRLRLSLTEKKPGLPIIAPSVLGPFVLTLHFILENFDRLQINVLILLCCVGGYLQVARNRCIWGGAIIGFAASIKVLPVFLLPYFLWKKWWGAALGTLMAGVGCTVLPVLVFGPFQWWLYLQRWREIVATQWGVQRSNQSLYAMVDRFYTGRFGWWVPNTVDFTASHDPVVALVVYGLMLLVVALFLYATRRGGDNPSSPEAIVEFAAVLVIAVLFSPLAWRHYFVFLLLAHTVLWRAAFVPDDSAEPFLNSRDGAWNVTGSNQRIPVPKYWLSVNERRRTRWLLGFSLLMMMLSVQFFVGRRLSYAFLLFSVVTVGAFLVLVALLHLRLVMAGQKGAQVSAPVAAS